MRTGLPIAGESLAGIEVFAGLDLAARTAVASRCSGAEYAVGDVILSHMDESRDIFFVLSGTVEVSLFSRSGRRITFNDKGPGQMVGELSAIDGKPRSAHVIANSNCRIAAIAPAEFLEIVDTYSGVARFMREHLVRQVRLLSERVFEFNALGVNNRIHVELLRRAQSTSGDGATREISPIPTHAEIASRASTHREAVTRELSRLTKEGVLAKSREALVVVDIERLEKLVEEALGEIPMLC
jgi:CRP/FNR family cyclic AMP-dependent transcriptional regulator